MRIDDRPSTKREVALIALRTLEDAVAQAQAGEVDRTWGQRLALTWLVHNRAAKQWQSAAFRDALTDANDWACTSIRGQQHRINTLMDLC